MEKKQQQHIIDIFYTGYTLYNIKRKKQKTVCAELAFPKVTFDRMVMHFFFIEFVIFYLFAMQFDYCNIQSSKVGTPNCFCSHKLCFNASKLYQKWKKLVNVPVCHIYNAFKLRVTFSTFPSQTMLYIQICWECLADTIHIMLYYLYLQLFT